MFKLPTTKDCEIVILDSPKNGQHYGVLNRLTNVIEHTDAFLARAFFAMRGMQQGIDKMKAKLDDDKPSVVQLIRKENETDKQAQSTEVDSDSSRE